MIIDPATGKDPETARQFMADALIETRRLWRPMHMQPVYKDAPYYGGHCCESLFDKGLCLPSGSNLSDDDLQCVANVLIAYMKK